MPGPMLHAAFSGGWGALGDGSTMLMADHVQLEMLGLIQLQWRQLWLKPCMCTRTTPRPYWDEGHDCSIDTMHPSLVLMLPCYTCNGTS